MRDIKWRDNSPENHVSGYWAMHFLNETDYCATLWDGTQLGLMGTASSGPDSFCSIIEKGPF